MRPTIQPHERRLPSSAECTEVDVVCDGVEDVGGEVGAVSGFNPRRMLTALRRFWWIALITVLVGGGIGVGVAKLLPPRFVSKAVMWEAVKIKLPEGGLFAEDVQNFLGTQSELLKSAALRDLALDRLRIGATNVIIPLGTDGKAAVVDIQMRAAAKSAVYTLTATGPTPDYTRAFLNALMHAYTDYKRDIRKSISGDTLASIAQQVQASERDLKEAQDAFSAYQRSNNLAILQQEGMVAGTYLAQLRTRLADLELESRLLTIAAFETNAAGVAAGGEAAGSGAAPGTEAWMQSAAGGGGVISGVVPMEVQAGLRELQALVAQRDRLGKFLRPKHPKMVKLNADIEKVDSLLRIYRRQNQEQLTAARKSVDIRMENVKASIHQWQAKVLESNARIAEAEGLRLQVQRAQSVNDRLVLLVQNVGISRNIDQDTLAILETATAPVRSYRTQGMAVGLGVLGGLSLGMLVVGLLAWKDEAFHSQFDLDEQVGAVVVGQVPEIPLPRKGLPLPVLLPDDSRHVFAESYRSLRSALFYLSSDLPRPAILLVTSAVPGEGKSTIGVNLARTLAFGGCRVLLIDADLRRGRLHAILGSHREPGLSDLLRDPGLTEVALHSDGIANLTFLSAGSLVANPGDLLLGPAFARLLEQMRQRFDYVLIDTCPVFAAADAATIAAQVDGTLFIVRRGYSKAPLVREAIETLRQRRARILGVVFNRADASVRGYHYYKYSEYHPVDPAGKANAS